MSMKLFLRPARKRWAAAIALFCLAAATAIGQNLTNTGTITNNSGGTIRVKGTLTPGQTSIGGTVEFFGTTQTVPAITYSNLKVAGTSGDKTLAAGKTVITGDITVNQTSNGLVVAASDTLDLQKTTTVPVTVTSGTFDATAGLVTYTTSGQVIYGTTYGDLITSGGDKTTSGDITVGTGKTFTNSVVVDFGSNAFTGTGGTFANSATLKSQGTVTLGSSTTVNGKFVYNKASGSQTVANAIYSDTLDVQGAATKTIGDLTLNGVYSVAGGSRTYNGTVTYSRSGGQTIAADPYNNLTLSGSGNKSFSGTTSIAGTLTASAPVIVSSGTTSLGTNATANIAGNLTVNGTFDASASGATTNFDGGSQSISGSAGSISFNNLTLSGSAAKTSALNLNVAGTFTPTRGIDMGASAVLNITNTAAGAVGSYGSLEEVKGTMKRAIASTGAAYTMNDSATTLTFASATPSDFTLKVEPGVNPTGYGAATHVNRKITASYTSWSSGTLTMTAGYLNAEKPSADENKVRLFKGSTKLATGNATTRVAATSSSFGQISLAGIAPGSSTLTDAQLPSGTELIMSNAGAAIMTIANNASWNNTATWDEGVVPTANDDVEINSTNITIAANAVASSLTVNSGKSLAVDGANLTVSNGTTNNGTITVSATRSLQVAASGTGTLTNGGTLTNSGTITVGN